MIIIIIIIINEFRRDASLKQNFRAASDECRKLINVKKTAVYTHVNGDMSYMSKTAKIKKVILPCNTSPHYNMLLSNIAFFDCWCFVTWPEPRPLLANFSFCGLVSLTVNPHAKFQVCIFSHSRYIRGSKSLKSLSHNLGHAPFWAIFHFFLV